MVVNESEAQKIATFALLAEVIIVIIMSARNFGNFSYWSNNPESSRELFPD